MRPRSKGKGSGRGRELIILIKKQTVKMPSEEKKEFKKKMALT